jgi:hypothetical protein
LLTVTVCAGGLGGGAGALVTLGGGACLGDSVAVALSVALVNAIATPPSAMTAIAAATPKINCGSRCHVRGL